MNQEVELKAKMRLAGVKVQDACERLKRPYGTVTGWINGIAPLPDEARREIETMIAERVKISGDSLRLTYGQFHLGLTEAQRTDFMRAGGKIISRREA